VTSSTYQSSVAEPISAENHHDNGEMPVIERAAWTLASNSFSDKGTKNSQPTPFQNQGRVLAIEVPLIIDMVETGPDYSQWQTNRLR